MPHQSAEPLTDLFEFGSSRQTRVDDLVAEFDVLGGNSIALVRWDSPWELKERVLAAVVSYDLRLKGVDHFRRAYGGTQPRTRPLLRELQCKAYRMSVEHLNRVYSRLESELAEPTLGEFGSSVVLERLPSSFFSAHLLFVHGRLFDALTVSRFILEQIAWAWAARSADSHAELDAIRSNKSISRLKEMFPEVGPLYGQLSVNAHLDYDNHYKFLDLRNAGGGKIILGHGARSASEEAILPFLADYAVCVYEVSQRRFLRSFESTNWRKGSAVPKASRGFLRNARQLARQLYKAAKTSTSTAAPDTTE
jgi:hypothetical protein